MDIVKIQDFQKYPTKEDLEEYLRRECMYTGNILSWIKSHVPKETKFQEQILDWLRARRADSSIDPHAFIFKQGAAPYQRQGLPDIWLIAEGKTFCFEVKRPYIGELSDIQKATIADINAAGGIACEVTYINEVAEVLRKHGFLTEGTDAIPKAGRGRRFQNATVSAHMRNLL